jgi:hypothetical protein
LPGFQGKNLWIVIEGKIIVSSIYENDQSAEESMGDLTVNRTNLPVSGQPAIETSEQQTMAILNNQQLDGNEKLAKLSETFKNLPEADAKALLQRLGTKNGNDPLSRDFHEKLGAGAAPLLTTLKNQSGMNAAPVIQDVQIPKALNQPDGTAQKEAKKFEGKMREAALRDRLIDPYEAKSKAKEILQNKNLTEPQKQAAMQELLKKASPEDFKDILAMSDKLSNAENKVMSQAMANSPDIMKRIAKELGPDEQAKVANNIAEFGWADDGFNVGTEGLSVWAQHASPEAMNSALKTAKDPWILRAAIGNSGKEKEIISKLDPEAKAIVMAQDYKFAPNSDPRKSPEFHPHNLAEKFNSLNAAEKNAFIDQLQNQGLLTDFLQREVGHIDQRFLTGINKENVKFMLDTYETMAKTAAMNGDKKSATAFTERALHLKGWIENKFRE